MKEKRKKDLLISQQGIDFGGSGVGSFLAQFFCASSIIFLAVIITSLSIIFNFLVGGCF